MSAFGPYGHARFRKSFLHHCDQTATALTFCVLNLHRDFAPAHLGLLLLTFSFVQNWGLFMRRLFTTLIATFCVIAFTQIASAADLPRKAPAAVPAPPPVANWTGCYLAGGGGYGLFAVDHYGIGTEGQQSFLPMTTGGNGWLGTVGAGCDYQFAAGNWGNWLVGAFGDYDWMDIKGDHGWSCRFASGCNFLGGTSPTQGAAGELKEKWAWYVGARLGFVVAPNVMTYVSGGYTQTRFDETQILVPSGTFAGSGTGAVLEAQTYHGWFLGGGTEIAFPWVPNLFLKSEYRYAKYAAKNVPEVCKSLGIPGADAGCGGIGATGVLDHQQPVVQTVRTELVYRFNWR
jgi:outer membrane immunogenic protein